MSFSITLRNLSSPLSRYVSPLSIYVVCISVRKTVTDHTQKIKTSK